MSYDHGNNGGWNRGGGGGGWKGGNGGGNGGQGGGWKGKSFQKETGPVFAYKAYAVDGNRDAPDHLKPVAERIVRTLDAAGYKLRVRGVSGFCEFFTHAAKQVQGVELYLPWNGYSTNSKDPNVPKQESKFSFCDDRCLELTAKFHPALDTLPDWHKKVEASVTRLIFGQNLKSTPLFLIAWSEDGAESVTQKTPKTGNLSLAITLASALPIPVFNLQNPDAETRLYNYLGVNPNGQQNQGQGAAATGHYDQHDNNGNGYGKQPGSDRQFDF